MRRPAYSTVVKALAAACDTIEECGHQEGTPKGSVTCSKCEALKVCRATLRKARGESDG